MGYLAEWDAMVEAREQFSAAEKKKMKLSQDTLEGLRMTGMRNVMYIRTCMLKNYNNSIKVITEHLFTFLHSVCSFVEMARYLLSQKPGLFLLSERFNQDPLESFLGSSVHEEDEVITQM